MRPAQVAPLLNKRVELHHLRSRPELNGKSGTATDFHAPGGENGDWTRHRYTVDLDNGETVKVRPANTRIEGAIQSGAEAGDPECQYALGLAFADGDGVEVDYKLAIMWFEKCATQKHHPAAGPAAGMLGSMAVYGRGQPPSYRRGRELMQRAVDLGDALAASNMLQLKADIALVKRFFSAAGTNAFFLFPSHSPFPILT